jgi:hypothetical protein
VSRKPDKLKDYNNVKDALTPVSNVRSSAKAGPPANLQQSLSFSTNRQLKSVQQPTTAATTNAPQSTLARTRSGIKIGLASMVMKARVNDQLSGGGAHRAPSKDPEDEIVVNKDYERGNFSWQRRFSWRFDQIMRNKTGQARFLLLVALALLLTLALAQREVNASGSYYEAIWEVWGFLVDPGAQVSCRGPRRCW